MDEGYAQITTEAELRELVSPPIGAAADKVRRRLDALDREWLALAPFYLLGTAAADGSCDVSPKGDPVGATALVLGDTTVVLPDRPGNHRVDGFLNILSNPQVGLLFIVPGRGDTLRINGRARLLSDAPFFDRLTVKGHRPTLATLVEIDEVFYHCSKAFLRSALWKPETWTPEAVPSRARISKALERQGDSLETLETYYGAGYAEKLYR